MIKNEIAFKMSELSLVLVKVSVICSIFLVVGLPLLFCGAEKLAGLCAAIGAFAVLAGAVGGIIDSAIEPCDRMYEITWTADFWHSVRNLCIQYNLIFGVIFFPMCGAALVIHLFGMPKLADVMVLAGITGLVAAAVCGMNTLTLTIIRKENNE